MRSADWYFDFISPFSYLQCEQLALLEQKLQIRYRPVLFAGLLKAWGHKGPAEMVSKRRFTYRFVVWQARRLGIPLKFPPVHPFNPLPLLRLAMACDCQPDVIRQIFRFVWRDGRLGDLPIEWVELMDRLQRPNLEILMASSEIKEGLRQNTDLAVARGVFGVPTLMIGDEMFWGADATAMALDYVEAGFQFSDPEMLRAVEVPIGVERQAEKRR